MRKTEKQCSHVNCLYGWGRTKLYILENKGETENFDRLLIDMPLGGSAPMDSKSNNDVACLTISVLQACCAVTTEYGIPSNVVRKSTASLQIKISTAQLNFSNRNVILF